ncbi:MAG TPA: hypothetical protein VFB12_08250, partial [Ktedonobacteraceae bacterium]|nr:hypothetical protein [Ktedonobacteraceae bacterium]
MKPLMRRVFPLSIRLQLTLWYISVFAVLLFVAGLLVYKHLETSLAGSLDGALQLRAQQLASGVSLQHDKIRIGDAFNELPGFDSDVPTQQASHGDVNWSSLVRLLDKHGKVVHETPAFRDLVMP